MVVVQDAGALDRERLQSEAESAVERFWSASGSSLPPLGGWPARLQGVREEPFPCPECGMDALLLYQLDSDAHSEVTWGDGGRAWLAACPQHPDRPFYFKESS